MILAALLAAYAFPAWPLVPADVLSLREGQHLHKDFEDGALRGSIIRFFVRTDLHRVYGFLADVPAMPRYMPHLREIRVVAQREGVKVLEYKSQVPLVADFTLERHFEPPRRIWWTKVKAPYKRIEGAWDLFPAPGGTVVSYSLAVETGSLIPNWMAAEFQKQGGSALVRNVTRHVESGGKWTRPDYPQEQTPN
ncbi:MAG: SRPBCC family protein [Candidatus Sericytochromatia bacterium]|nr:SRPBCC family protein [Candidatus Tanganyikabacteria bacterium]